MCLILFTEDAACMSHEFSTIDKTIVANHLLSTSIKMFIIESNVGSGTFYMVGSRLWALNLRPLLV